MGFLVETLASFAHEGSLRQAPPHIQTEVRRAAFNWLGCAVGGSQRDATAVALRAVKAVSGPARASVLGSRERLDCSNAAFINCIASSVDASAGLPSWGSFRKPRAHANSPRISSPRTSDGAR